MRARSARRQHGATAVEFALVFAFIFMPLMLGMVDFSRWLYAANSAAEATRLGARIATVCDPFAAGIKLRMLAFLPTGTAVSDIPDPEYLSGDANGCGPDPNNVCGVRVYLEDLTVAPQFAFFLPGDSYLIPDFSTVLPRESLQTVVGGSANPLCS